MGWWDGGTRSQLWLVKLGEKKNKREEGGRKSQEKVNFSILGISTIGRSVSLCGKEPSSVVLSFPLKCG